MYSRRVSKILSHTLADHVAPSTCKPPNILLFYAADSSDDDDKLTMTNITLYGIKNCDTVKKARKWLDNANVDYQFHDFREDGLSKKQVSDWVKTLGWETVVNKRSTTWKQLDAAARDNMNEASAISSILEHPTLIKRPLLDCDGEYSVGFKETDYQNRF